MDISRRTKIAYLDESAIVTLLNLWQTKPEFIRIDDTRVPDDVYVRGVYQSIDPCGINVVLQHESFDEVPVGEFAPRIGGPGLKTTTWHAKEYKLPEEFNVKDG
jgi:hypothetical protein